MRCLKIYFILILLSISSLVAAQFSTLPYFCSFEEVGNNDDSSSWQFSKRSSVNTGWCIGHAAYLLGKSGLYVSFDGGTSAGYDYSAAGYVSIAYREFTLEQGDYTLKFDYRLFGEEASTADVLFVAIAPASVPNSSLTASVGSTIPSEALNYRFTDNSGKAYFTTSMLWKAVSGDFTIKESGDYKLVFLFKANGNDVVNNPGACIDNVQLSKKEEPSCSQEPQGIQVTQQDEHLIVTWEGDAQSYDLLYHTFGENSTAVLVEGIAANRYEIASNELQEGCYFFRVRARCDDSASLFSDPQEFLFYDSSRHCFNFIDLESQDVTCTLGTFEFPKLLTEVVDEGYASQSSIHTCHFVPYEYDIRTGYKLKTVPDGSPASVRLSNWTEKTAPSGTITYSYDVGADDDILLVKYAAVLQYYNVHDADNQTRIRIRVLSEEGDELDSECTSIDFNAADVANGNTRGWNTYQPVVGDGTDILYLDCPIKWLNWSEVSLNLKPYAGQKIKIEIAVSACSANMHFGYIYFALDCVSSQLKGASCSAATTQFTAPQGFYYKWYKRDDAQKVLSLNQIFSVDVNDTTTYCVDLISRENPNCVHTLTAYTANQYPVASATYTWNPHDCQNEVALISTSTVCQDVDNDVVVDSTARMDTYIWDLGAYGIAYGENILFEFPQEGDTLTVTLKTRVNGCVDETQMLLEIPSIKPNGFGKKFHYICAGDSVMLYGNTYKKAGTYQVYAKTKYGCDSAIALHIDVLEPTFIDREYIQICKTNLPYIFYGDSIYEEGHHYVHIPSSLGGNCDTLIYHAYFLFTNGMETSFDVDLSFELCQGEDRIVIPYKVLQGQVHKYSLEYDTRGIANGMRNIPPTPIDRKEIIIPIPKNAKPDRYKATLNMINESCGTDSYEVNLLIQYPSSVIKQLWNDVLAIKNATYNGGYDIEKVEWFCGDEKLESHPAAPSMLYQQNEKLRFKQPYHALLTRVGEDYSIPTCDFFPQQIAQEELVEISSLTFIDAAVTVKSNCPAKAEIYDLHGRQVSQFAVYEGLSSFKAPSKEGFYLIKLKYQSGKIEAKKLVVRQK